MWFLCLCGHSPHWAPNVVFIKFSIVLFYSEARKKIRLRGQLLEWEPASSERQMHTADFSLLVTSQKENFLLPHLNPKLLQLDVPLLYCLCIFLSLLLTSSFSSYFFFQLTGCLFYLFNYSWIYLILIAIFKQKALGLKACARAESQHS